jgi:hypothetical protein
MYEIGDEDSIKLVVEKHGIKTEGFKNLPKRKPAVKFV